MHGDDGRAEAVAAALGVEELVDVEASRPPVNERDADDGTNEAIRQRVLLGNDASSDTPAGFTR